VREIEIDAQTGEVARLRLGSGEAVRVPLRVTIPQGGGEVDSGSTGGEAVLVPR